MSQARTRRLTVEFEGTAPDGHLQLKDFIEILDQLKVLLGDVERQAKHKQGVTVEYRVVALSHSSHARVGIEERVTAKKGVKDPVGLSTVQVGPTMISRLQRVGRTAFTPSEDEFDTLLAIEDLVEFVGVTAKSIKLRSGSQQVSLTPAYKKRFERYMGPDLLTLGTIQGTLEALDLHRKHRCYIYPELGASRVRVDFSPELTTDVMRALQRRVRFAGRLAYKSFSPSPYRVLADAVEVLPEDHELPLLGDLKGLFADAYGDSGPLEWIDE